MRKTSTILAVAFTTSACGGAASEASHDQPTQQQLAQELSNTPLEDALKNRQHFAPLCDKDGYPLPGNINSKESAAKVSQLCAALGPKSPQTSDPAPPKPDPAPPKPDPTPTPAPTCDRNALNQELSSSYLLDDALAKHAYFRCLCDDKGYPLVGNINAKGTTASAFCRALKEKGLL